MKKYFLFLLLSSVGCSSNDTVPVQKTNDSTSKLLEAKRNRGKKPVVDSTISNPKDGSVAKNDSVPSTSVDTTINIATPSQPKPQQSNTVQVVYITTSQHPITKTDYISPALPAYTRVKNAYWQHCRYKDFITDLLEAELQYTLSQNKKPMSYYSQWFLDLYNPEYTTDDILKYYEQCVIAEITTLYKTTSINHDKAWQRLPCVVRNK